MLPQTALPFIRSFRWICLFGRLLYRFIHSLVSQFSIFGCCCLLLNVCHKWYCFHRKLRASGQNCTVYMPFAIRNNNFSCFEFLSTFVSFSFNIISHCTSAILPTTLTYCRVLLAFIQFDFCVALAVDRCMKHKQKTEFDCSRVPFDIYMTFSLYFLSDALWLRQFNKHFQQNETEHARIKHRSIVKKWNSSWQSEGTTHNENNEPEKLNAKYRIPLFFESLYLLSYRCVVSCGRQWIAYT